MSTLTGLSSVPQDDQPEEPAETPASSAIQSAKLRELLDHDGDHEERKEVVVDGDVVPLMDNGHLGVTTLLGSKHVLVESKTKTIVPVDEHGVSVCALKPDRQYHSLSLWQLYFQMVANEEGRGAKVVKPKRIAVTWYQPELTGDVRPPALTSHTAVVTSAKDMLVFGGMLESGNASNECYLLSSETGTWSLLKPTGDIPQPRYYHTAVLVDNQMLVFGGINDEGLLCDNDMYVLDLDTLEWRIEEVHGDSPLPRYGHTCNVFQDKLVFFGGMGVEPVKSMFSTAKYTKKLLNDLYVYDVRSSVWLQVPTTGDPPVPTAFHAATICGDSLYIYGGKVASVLGVQVPTNQLWVLQLRYWSYHGPYDYGIRRGGSTSGVTAHSLTSIGQNVLVLFGGDHLVNQRAGRLLFMDIQTPSWLQPRYIIGTEPRLSGHSMVRIGTAIWLFGGRDLQGLTNDLHVLDLAAIFANLQKHTM